MGSWNGTIKKTWFVVNWDKPRNFEFRLFLWTENDKRQLDHTLLLKQATLYVTCLKILLLINYWKKIVKWSYVPLLVYSQSNIISNFLILTWSIVEKSKKGFFDYIMFWKYIRANMFFGGFFRFWLCRLWKKAILR